MKKTITLTLTAVMLILLFTPVFAANTTSINIISDKQKYQPNDTATITIKVDNANDIYGLNFKLSYDPAYLILKQDGVKNLAWQDGQGFFYTENGQGFIKYVGTKLGDVPGERGNVSLVEIKFTAQKEGTTTIKVTGIEASNSEGVLMDVNTTAYKSIKIEKEAEPEAPKPEEPKPGKPKPEEPKPEEPKPEEPKPQKPKPSKPQQPKPPKGKQPKPQAQSSQTSDKTEPLTDEELAGRIQDIMDNLKIPNEALIIEQTEDGIQKIVLNRETVEAHIRDILGQIEELLKGIQDEQQKQKVIEELSTISIHVDTNEDIQVEMDASILKLLKDNNLSLVLQYPDMEMLLPYGCIQLDKYDGTLVFNKKRIIDQDIISKLEQKQEDKKGINRVYDLSIVLIRDEQEIPITNFEDPITLTFNLQDEDLIGIDKNTLSVYWYDEQNDTLVDMNGGYIPEKNAVEVELDHFSIYLLMADVQEVVEKQPEEEEKPVEEEKPIENEEELEQPEEKSSIVPFIVGGIVVLLVVVGIVILNRNRQSQVKV